MRRKYFELAPPMGIGREFCSHKCQKEGKEMPKIIKYSNPQ